tara:strand:- start:818 stop:1750 length:933 start_codon:yes stop_codon:yes gene_type:complete
MQLNNTTLVDRGNRPNISQRIGLRTFFINDGAYVDPYEISGVGLFTKSDTLSPKTVIGVENLVSSTPLMQFGASGETLTSHDNFDVTNYVPSITASGIYRISTGEYVVVLDETLALSGWDYTTNTQVAASSLSAVNDYVDLWTVKLNSASKYQVITNQFSLHEDTFFAFTEPLLLTTSNKLMNKHVRFGEKINLKIGTEVTIQNQDIDKSVQNIFKDSCITSGAVEIRKVNQDSAFDGPFVVASFSDTSSGVDITKDNTLLFNWDTTELTELPSFTSGSFGSLTGTYSVQVKYTLLTQTIMSPLFYLTVS